MEKLIPMTDFVLNLDNNELNKINYAKFLKQPLELWMFVPCDEHGNVLEKPIGGMFSYEHIYNNYNKAQEKVLFEGFEVVFSKDKIVVLKNALTRFPIVFGEDDIKLNIEHFQYDKLELTDSAIKQIYR